MKNVKIKVKHDVPSGLTILQIAFIILKLCGVIHWSWWWVLSPIWITATFVVICIILGIIALLK